jgi:hypothetical protein
MLRALLCSTAVLALCVGGALAQATKDNKDNKNKNKGKQAQATITKVDAKNGTVTVRMKNKEGKEETRTFKLTEDIRYFDSTGRVAAIDIFRSGDEVLVVEERGQLKEMKKPAKNSGGKSGAGSTEKKPGGK